MSQFYSLYQFQSHSYCNNDITYKVCLPYNGQKKADIRAIATAAAVVMRVAPTPVAALTSLHSSFSRSRVPPTLPKHSSYTSRHSLQNVLRSPSGPNIWVHLPSSVLGSFRFPQELACFLASCVTDLIMSHSVAVNVSISRQQMPVTITESFIVSCCSCSVSEGAIDDVAKVVSFAFH